MGTPKPLLSHKTPLGDPGPVSSTGSAPTNDLRFFRSGCFAVDGRFGLRFLAIRRYVMAKYCRHVISQSARHSSARFARDRFARVVCRIEESFTNSGHRDSRVTVMAGTVRSRGPGHRFHCSFHRGLWRRDVGVGFRSRGQAHDCVRLRGMIVDGDWIVPAFLRAGHRHGRIVRPDSLRVPFCGTSVMNCGTVDGRSCSNAKKPS